MSPAGRSDRWPILVTRRVSPRVLEAMRAACDVDLWDSEAPIPRDELLERVAGKRAAVTLLTEKVDRDFLDAGSDLAIVANYAVGFDNIDVAECTRHGVLASNTLDVLTATTADLTWSLLMAAARRVAEGRPVPPIPHLWIWATEMMLGQDVHGKTLGIVGFGRIGQAVARRGLGFRMRIRYYDVQPPPKQVTDRLQAERLDLDTLAGRIGLHISIHVALTPETKHLFDAEAFRKKETAVVVNSSRGPVVDESALVEVLEKGEIFAAGARRLRERAGGPSRAPRGRERRHRPPPGERERGNSRRDGAVPPRCGSNAREPADRLAARRRKEERNCPRRRSTSS
jgi:glyoxylate reductase